MTMNDAQWKVREEMLPAPAPLSGAGMSLTDDFFNENVAQAIAPGTNPACPNGGIVISAGGQDAAHHIALTRPLFDAKGDLDRAGRTTSIQFPLARNVSTQLATH